MRFFYPQRLRPLFLLAVLLLLRAGQPLFAQAPTWHWADSPGTGSGYSTAVDAAGNVYVAGVFAGTVRFGATTLTSVGSGDVFVAKLSTGGVYQWAVRAGGARDDRAVDIAVDGSGNVAITGFSYSPTIAFGATVVTNASAPDLFVAKLTPAGIWQWATSSGGSGDSRSVAIDGSGNVVVAGDFASSTITFGTTTLTNSGNADAFVAKLTPTGAWQWATKAGGIGNDIATDVALDGSGNIFVTGDLGSPVITFGATTLTNSSGTDVFVAKLTSSGSWQWANSTDGIRDDNGLSIAVDVNGNVVITGFFFSSSITFGTTTLTNAGIGDIFVAKLTPAGSWQWATSVGGNDQEEGTSVTLDSNGNVTITGYFTSTAITFGATTLSNAGATDLFVAKLNPGGIWQWATGAGGSESDESNTVAVDGSGNVVIAGIFDSPSLTFGATTLTYGSILNNGIFLARLSTANGLPEDPTQPAFTLAPNPARTTVQVTGAAGTTATLLDGLGRVVGTAILSPAGTATLAVGTLPAGLYLVRVGSSKARRLVVE